MKSLLYILQLSFLALTSCHNQDLSICDKIINIESIPERRFDDLIDEIECIPLEKTSDALFDCWKLIAYKNYFYIYSLSDFAVSIYNNNGEFIKRIDNRGKGKIETPTDIIININNDELWICDSRTKINKYSLEGSYIESIQTPTKCIKMTFVDNNTILTYEGLFEESSSHLFNSYTKDWKKKGEFVNKGKMINTPTSYPPSLFAKDLQENTTYAILFQKSIIYKYEKGELKPFIYLDFNNNLLTEDKYPQNGFSDEQLADIINRGEYIYTIQDFQSISKKIFFKTLGNNPMYYLINCNDGENYKFESLFDKFKPRMTNPVAGSDDKYLYLVQKKIDLINHYKNKECNYNEINNIILSKEDFDEVIIRIKLKSF